VDFVAVPGGVAFGAEPGVGVIGRANQPRRWREIGSTPQADRACVCIELLDPDLAQQRDGWVGLDDRWGGWRRSPREQLPPIRADRFGQCLALG